MNRQTTLAKTGETKARWYVVDASDQVLGRISSKLARRLMGKHKPEYTPHVDTGDFIIVTNVEKVRLTGSKEEAKVFQTYSGYPGGQKRFTYKWMLAHKPELLLQRAIRRMMPKSKLGEHMLTKLKLYKGTAHPHSAQKPEPLPL